MVDIDRPFEGYASLLEDGGYAHSEPESVMDESCGLVFDDIKDSIFYRGRGSSCPSVNDAPMTYTQQLIHEDTHEAANTSDTFNGLSETMETETKYLLDGLGLVIKDLELDSKGHRPYVPTILMPRCAYFPSFGGEEVADDES